jgi:sugar phosphate isomerase/epimerase
MKKIGVALYNNFRGSIESFLGFSHNLNVDYVEIGKEWIPKRDEIRGMRDLLDIYDLKANLHVSYPYNLAEIDERKWKRNILGVLGDLGVCYDLNIEQAVLHCGWVNWDNSSSEVLKEGFERFGDAFNIISDFSDDFGVEIGLENQCSEGFKQYLFENHDSVDRLNEHVDCEMKYVLDVGHLGRTGTSLDNMMDRIGKNLIGIHIHDYNEQGKDHLPLGTGKLDINKLFRIIREKDLFITIENRSIPHIKHSLLHSPLASLCHPIHKL